MQPIRSAPTPRSLALAGVGLLALLSLAPAALAAGPARLNVLATDALGKYLADGFGRGLYVFVDPAHEDALGTAADRPTPPCDASCRGVWPPLLSDGAPDAVPAIPADRVGTVQTDGGTQVTFDGWPLYRFATDRSRGDIAGEGIEPPDDRAFGGAWYLIAPDGSLVKPADDREAGGAKGGDAGGANGGGANAGGGGGAGGGKGGYY